jgi:hypothetical protein
MSASHLPSSNPEFFRPNPIPGASESTRDYTRSEETEHAAQLGPEKFASDSHAQPKPDESSRILFPDVGYVGGAAEIADLYSQHHEASKEFVYMDLLTLIGTVLSGRWEVDFGDLNTQPRLYTLKIAKSGWSRKSTATRFSERVITCAVDRSDPGAFLALADDSVAPLQIIYGVGSAEGLIGQFRHQEKVGSPGSTEWRLVGNPRIVVSFDEFRRFEKKARGESAVLLYAVNELYDRNSYDNCTKGISLSARNAHLGFIANTTEETFRGLLDGGELEDIGFLNRIFYVVNGDKRRRVPRPRSIERELDPLISELADLFRELPAVDDEGKCESPIRLQLTNEADRLWADYYIALPETKITARLDAMGPRLMGILAFVSGKREIDVEIVRVVLALLKYQHRVREAFQPVVGDTADAKLETRIYQAHRRHVALSENECRRHSNGYRVSSRTWTAVYDQFRVRHLQPSAFREGDRTERYELKPGALRD